jgi:hypothetical protein
MNEKPRSEKRGKKEGKKHTHTHNKRWKHSRMDEKPNT